LDKYGGARNNAVFLVGSKGGCKVIAHRARSPHFGSNPVVKFGAMQPFRE